MASRTLSRYLPLFALLIPGLSASDFACHWAPMRTNHEEALEVRCVTPGGMQVKLHVTVEASAKGHALKIASGWPDRHNLLPAPIEDLNTYRVTRLTIRIGKSEYVVENPEQNFTLDSPAAN